MSSIEENPTWFEGSKFEVVRNGGGTKAESSRPTPFHDSLPRSPDGIVQGFWFNETTGRAEFIWGPNADS